MRVLEGQPFHTYPGFHPGKASTLRKLQRLKRIEARKRPETVPSLVAAWNGYVYQMPATKKWTRGRAITKAEPPKGLPPSERAGFAGYVLQSIKAVLWGRGRDRQA
jgi:hypothetical protein